MMAEKMTPTLQQVRDAIGLGRFPKNTLRLIQQAHKQWRGAIEAGRNGACDIRSWMRYLAMRNIRWNQRLPNSFDLAEWYGSALAFAEAGLMEEFLAVREKAAGEAVRDVEADRMRQIAALDRRIDAAGVWVV
jgi:hypothetical protein